MLSFADRRCIPAYTSLRRRPRRIQSLQPLHRKPCGLMVSASVPFTLWSMRARATLENIFTSGLDVYLQFPILYDMVSRMRAAILYTNETRYLTR